MPWATLSEKTPGAGDREMPTVYLSIHGPDSTMEQQTGVLKAPPSATDCPACLSVPCFSVPGSVIKNPEDQSHFFSIQCMFCETKHMIDGIRRHA